MTVLTPELAAKMLDVVARRQRNRFYRYPLSVLEAALTTDAPSKFWKPTRAQGQPPMYERPPTQGRQ